jgi:hypothetical protein
MLDPKYKALELVDEHYTEIIGMGVSEEVLKAYAVKLALITVDKMYQVAVNMDEMRLRNYCTDIEIELLNM